MKALRQNGFSTIMMSLAVLAGALSAFTVVEFNAFRAKAQVAEAFHVADEARLRVTEFYLLSNRFPSTTVEVEALKRNLSTRSDYVRDIVVEQSYNGYDVALKIYLDDDRSSGAGTTPFVYVAGEVSARGSQGIDWTCGGHGVDAKLLPGECESVDG